MGLGEWLRGAALRPLRRWIRRDCELEFSWSMRGLELRMAAVELDPQSLNREALHLSPLILHRASLQSARLAIAIIGAPAIALLVDDLQVELATRHANDSYWESASDDQAARDREEKLATIDPEGAAEHARAKKLEKGVESSSFLTRLLINFLLSAVRVEVQKVAVLLRSTRGDEGRVSCSKLILTEGTENGFFGGSFLGSTGNLALSRGNSSSKPFQVSMLQLRINTSESRKKPHLVDDDSSAQQAVLVMMLWITCCFSSSKFSGLRARVPEAVLGLDSTELQAAMIMLEELQGPSVKKRDLEPGNFASSGFRSGKELWSWGISKALSKLPGRRLTQTLKAGVLRRRYSHLYGDWFQVVKKSGASDSTKKLSASVDELEKQLPVEAVALARFIARKRKAREELSSSDDHNSGTGAWSLRFFRERWRSFRGYQKLEVEADGASTSATTSYSVDITRGSAALASFDGSRGVAICIKLKRASFEYSSSENSSENSFILGGLQGELLALNTRSSEVSSGDECRVRWGDSASTRFVFFTSSALENPGGGKFVEKYAGSVQGRFSELKSRGSQSWSSKAWGEALDLKAPFMVAFNRSSKRENISMLSCGRADGFLKPVVFSWISPLVHQLKELLRNDQGASRGSSAASSSSRTPAALFRNQLSSLREALLSAVPASELQLFVIIESLRLTLSGSDEELPGRKTFSSDATLDSGYLEFALWPLASGTQDCDWVRRPPLLEQPVQSFLERVEYKNNFVAMVEGLKLVGAGENLLGPLTITLESSMGREHLSSFFSASKTVCLAADLTIPEIIIDLQIDKLAAAIQAFSYYSTAGLSVYSQLSGSQAGEPHQSEELISTDACFSLEFNATFGGIQISLGDLDSSGKTTNSTGALAAEKLWLCCSAGDHSNASLSTGFRNLSLEETRSNSAPINTMHLDHFIVSFTGPEVNDVEDDQFYCSLEIDCGLVFITRCSLESIIAKARLFPATRDNLRGVLSLEKESGKISGELEGGLAVFETQATAEVLNFAGRYVESLVAKLGGFSPDERGENELKRSVSFPETVKPPGPPFRSQSAPEETLQLNNVISERSLFFKIGGLSVVLGISGARDVEGVLLEFSAHSNVSLLRSCSKITADVTQFTVISLRSVINQKLEEKQGQVPQFGLQAHGESLKRKESISANLKQKTTTDPSYLSYILDCFSLSTSLSKQPTRGIDLKWRDSWQGHISASGFDIAVTTYELQVLLKIMATLSQVSFSSGDSQKAFHLAGEAIERGSQDIIPDEAIIALKDAQEHLYLSVEDDSGSSDQFHLGGAWHYSVAGERALFKVKYQEKNKKKWFSLHSLYAKDSTGSPLRLRYRSGSRQLEISSTNDNGELWQCIPYRNSGDEEMNIYSEIFSHLVHLINYKSKQGVALADGIPTISKHPGNAFKVEIVAGPALQETSSTSSIVSAASSIPQVRFDLGSVSVTLLHEAARAVHLLPLIRIRLDEVQGLAHASSYKVRTIGGCTLNLEHYEAQSSSWLPIVNPVMIEVICCVRLDAAALKHRKFPTSVFCRLKKVEVVLSELSLDVCLFLIGVMDLAGPYTIKHSPVLANRCQIENQTGLNVLFRFEREGGGKEEGQVSAWQTGSYLIRHVTSRRGTSPAEVSVSAAISLEKPDTGLSSAVQVFLGEPGVFAARTRLEAFEDSRQNSPGPIVVVDVSKQSQTGIFVTVSPMVKIHNATGLVLQVRCRRAKQGEGGALVTLQDGDIIDDSMGAFDALNLEGEMKKALLSFNVGNFLLSIRPADNETEGTYEWSEDVRGAKAVRASGLFEKLQYGFKKTLKSKSLESSFGSVFCRNSSETGSGRHFLIRTLRRQVPVTKPSSDQKQKRTLVAWQEQQELLLLPMLRVFNFLSSTVHLSIGSKNNPAPQESSEQVTIPASGGKVFLYADLSALCFILKIDDYNLVSEPVDVSTEHKQFQELAKKGGSLKDLEIEVKFSDDSHVATLKVYRADDGVLALVIFTKYTLRNESQVPILCCVAKSPSRWQRRRVVSLQWPHTAFTLSLSPKSSVSWFPRSNKMLIKREEDGSQPTLLDLDSLSGSSESSLALQTPYYTDIIQLGIQVQVPSQAHSDPSHLIRLAPRYNVVNQSSQQILVCQDGLEGDEHHSIVVEPGNRVAVHAQQLEKKSERSEKDSNTSSLSLRFRFPENGWRWSGRICAASLGSFHIKVRGNIGGNEKIQLALVQVEEVDSSLFINFGLNSREGAPYRIENRLRSGSITFHQKDVTESETLMANTSTDFAWDDLSLTHKLVVSVSGTQICCEVNLDKVKGWKSFAAAHRSKGFTLQLPFQTQIGGSNEGNQADELLDLGYEVYADGPTRVCRVCQKVDSTKKSYWESEMSIPRCKMEFKIPTLKIFMIETSKQRIEDLTSEDLNRSSSSFTPFLVGALASSSVEVFITSEHAVCQLRVQSLGADIKWQGAPFAAMLRIHDQDRLSSTTTALHAAFVLSNFAADPIQVKYASILLQAFDLNLDEDTLMKFVPFYRTSLSTSTSSLQLYFERFEIHPIKIVASFVPGHPRGGGDYTSAQETFRALLHTVIKLPSVRGATVELNGVLLSHALLTFKQLMLKCVQHYSWYTMRAIYIARGSKLLPPGFSSLFDDSAASSLDVFFDPASGSIDLQGITLGMFNLLSRGLRRNGQGGTSRYLGDLEKTVKNAGSNLVFAMVTEISDNVLKGAETNGFDGMINGFRRGVLNVAMEPLALQKAVVKGGSSRRIQLDRSVGTDEAYIEGYLQAMLDALFKQDYLKVKVMEDQVILKNLPPNSMLLNEIVACVKNFLISEGLLAGEASVALVRSMRLLRGESERKVVPAIISLSEQLLVIFAIRGLRQYTRHLLHIQGSSKSRREAAPEAEEEEQKLKEKKKADEQQIGVRPSLKRTLGNFFISSAIAYIDGRLCRHIPNELARRIVSGFLLSFVES